MDEVVENSIDFSLFRAINSVEFFLVLYLFGVDFRSALNGLFEVNGVFAGYFDERLLLSILRSVRSNSPVENVGCKYFRG